MYDTWKTSSERVLYNYLKPVVCLNLMRPKLVVFAEQNQYSKIMMYKTEMNLRPIAKKHRIY